MTGYRRRAARRSALAVALLAALALPGCSGGNPELAAPRCSPDRRLAIVAQSVPSAAYVPCLRDLATGWDFSFFDVREGSTRFTLTSDRTDAPVRVQLVERCDVGDATAVAPRAPGARTFLDLDELDPRYRGTLYDVFPGGCVRYDFGFERGAHIGLMEDLASQIDLFPRRELAREVADDLGVDLDDEAAA